MTRTITHSEFVNAAGDGVYVSTVHYASDAERKAGDAAVQRVVAAAAFVPFGDKGEPFDPPEAVSDSAFREILREHWSQKERKFREDVEKEIARRMQDPPEPWPSDKTATWVGLPNCEGYGHTLAHAQHEAAIDGDGCTAGACLLTRGSD